MLHATLVIRPSSVTESVLIWNKRLPSGCRDHFAQFFSEQSLLTNKLQANLFHNVHSTAQSQVRPFRKNTFLHNKCNDMNILYLLDSKHSDRSGKKTLHELYSIYRVSSVTQNESNMLFVRYCMTVHLNITIERRDSIVLWELRWLLYLPWKGYWNIKTFT